MEQNSEKALNDLEKAGKQILDDEELGLVSGGEGFCWFDYCR